jgi:hypothetical protein
VRGERQPYLGISHEGVEDSNVRAPRLGAVVDQAHAAKHIAQLVQPDEVVGLHRDPPAEQVAYS